MCMYYLCLTILLYDPSCDRKNVQLEPTVKYVAPIHTEMKYTILELYKTTMKNKNIRYTSKK